MVGHLLQYHPIMRAAAAQIADGACGTVRFIESRRCNIGKIYTERNVLWNFGPHDLTLVLLAVPGQQPVSVRCTGVDAIAAGCHDVVHVSIAFAGGAQAHLTLSWISALKEAQWLVYGDQGSLVVDDTMPWEQKSWSCIPVMMASWTAGWGELICPSRPVPRSRRASR